MSGLAGRRILFIGIGFYDYEKCVVARLREQGAEVVAFEDRPEVMREGLRAGLLRRLRWGASRVAHRHEQRILDQATDYRFDQVIVIKGTELSTWLLGELRVRLPGAEFVLYQWDSLARLPGIQERLPFFDRVLTFDRHDALAHPELAFRPLFFRESTGIRRDEIPACDIDISFVGWLHSDRLAAVRRMEADARAQGLSIYVYLFTGVFTWLRLLAKGNANGIYLRPLPYGKLIEINKRSKCILDLPHAAQTGLTMRAIEALGLGKKLITTATDISNYDFYAAANVKVLHGDASTIDRAFVERAPAPVPTSVVRRYSLDAWIADVAGAGGRRSLAPEAGTGNGY